MLRLFQDNLIFGEANSSHFFEVTASTQELIFSELLYLQNSYFFLRRSLFRTVTSSQQLLFQNNCIFRAKLQSSSHFLKTGSSLGQLLCGKATFLVEKMFRIKISTEELLFRSRYFRTASAYS